MKVDLVLETGEEIMEVVKIISPFSERSTNIHHYT